MKTQKAIDHFGGLRGLARALGVSTQAIYAWGEKPPKGRQYELQYVTDGMLKIDKEFVRGKK